MRRPIGLFILLKLFFDFPVGFLSDFFILVLLGGLKTPHGEPTRGRNGVGVSGADPDKPTAKETAYHPQRFPSLLPATRTIPKLVLLSHGAAQVGIRGQVMLQYPGFSPHTRHRPRSPGWVAPHCTMGNTPTLAFGDGRTTTTTMHPAEPNLITLDKISLPNINAVLIHSSTPMIFSETSI